MGSNIPVSNESMTGMICEMNNILNFAIAKIASITARIIALLDFIYDSFHISFRSFNVKVLLS